MSDIDKPNLSPEVLAHLTKMLTDEGKIIAAGFAGFRLTMPRKAPQAQIDDMKIAFFAGATHLFRSVMAILDPGDEPTEQDLERMGAIDAEVECFEDWFKANYGKTKDNA